MVKSIYTKEVCDLLSSQYLSGVSPETLAEGLDVPVKSVIAKLSSMGVYKKKTYTNKLGEVPVRKSEYIDRIGVHIDMSPDMLDSLEKVNKVVLVRLVEVLDGM
jgi:hypothetical protein